MKKIFSTLLFLSVILVVNAQWSDNPTENNRITPLATEIYDHDIKVSADGTSFIVFNRPTGGNTATFLQIVDVDGNMLFSDQGMLISNQQTLSWTMIDQLLFVDDDGNAIVVVVDCRNAGGGYNISYTLYKVSPTGEMLWGENGLDLCEGLSFGTVAVMNIVQLDDGNYVCAWMVEESNVYIQMQKISKAGELLWNAADTRIYDPAIPNEYPYLVNAGNNEVVLVFSSGTIFNRNIKARKIDENFANVWSQDLAIYNGSFGYTPLWVIIRVIPDQMGGAFVGWFDDRNNTWTESTYVAHVKSDGTHGFPSGIGGEKMGYSSLRSFFPEMYYDKDEDFLYVAFRETNDNQTWQQMKAQKVKVSTGQLMWNSNGIDVSPLLYNHSIAFHTIQGDANNNVAIFFSSNTWHPEHFYGWDINNITLINSNGEYVWEDEIIEFSNPVGFKGSLLSTPLVTGNFWLTAWNDERVVAGDPDGKKKIYMQRINIDGTLGDNGSIICLPPTNIVIDNITYESADVIWTGETDDYELQYRIVGEEWISEIVISANDFILEYLVPNTDYQVRILSICSESQTSIWSEIETFTTLNIPIPPCESPINLNVEDVTDQSALLIWEQGNDQNTNYELQYRDATSDIWNIIEDIDETTYLLTDLVSNTLYLWSVRANCSEERISEWAEESEFTTDRAGISTFGEKAITVFAVGKMISIINPENIFIENVQLFDLNGKMLFDHIVNNRSNILIPIDINENVVIIKVIGKNEVIVYRLLLQ